MAEPLNDFGPVDELKPEAIGLPGNRRFRVLFRRGSRTVCFWMEKEQLGLLGDAISELLTQIPGGASSPRAFMPGEFSEPFVLQAQTGRMALGYSETSDTFLILVYDLETETAVQEQGLDPDNLLPTFRCEVTRNQLENFYRDTASVIQSGRPPKPGKNGHTSAN